MTNNQKNIKAIIEAGEVEKYSAEYFKLQGSRGGKIGSKIWQKLTPQQRSKRAKKGWATRRKKLLTD